MKKNILIFNGHPDIESFCNALANQFRISTFGPIGSSNNIKREHWLKKVKELGKSMK